MGRFFQRIKPYRRVFLAVMDAAFSLFAFFLVALVEQKNAARGIRVYGSSALIITGLEAVFLMLFGTNRNLWRYAGAKEYVVLIHCYAVAFASYIFVDKLIVHWNLTEMLTLLATCLALLASLYIRAAYRWASNRSRQSRKDPAVRRAVAIIGAGNAGVSLEREIIRNYRSPYSVWGFFDDDDAKIGMRIDGVPVVAGIDAMPDRLQGSPVQEIIVAIPSLDVTRRQEIMAMCQKLPYKVRILPDTVLISSTTDAQAPLEKSIRDVKIEDLLGRASVHFEKNELDPFVRGKTIVITGGGGSIGSEIARQIVSAGVGRLVIFDINENDSYMLFRELKPMVSPTCQVLVEIGSMCDRHRVEDLFAKYHPEVVFHAAAHKHVPLMENCPYEAVANNVFGTYNVMMAAKDFGCQKFVLISTDKAVNPTNIMGATKRFCEDMMLAISGAPGNKTAYSAVRFGNVLGSHGSVIPLFREQIARGGPVTVTDKRMTRYFMTIPEAAGLVIKSGAMAKNAEIYILKMGEPVKILSLAENLIRLSGFKPYEEIDIVESGLRPGEKLFEELLVRDDQHIATTHSKIFVEQNNSGVDMGLLEQRLDMLREAVDSADSGLVLRLMRRFVPNFKTPEEINGDGSARDLAEIVPVG